jgi:hypothetical protein
MQGSYLTALTALTVRPSRPSRYYLLPTSSSGFPGSV